MRNNFFKSYEAGDGVWVYTGRELIQATVVSYSYNCNSFEKRLIYALIPDVGSQPIIAHESCVFEDENDALRVIVENRVN